MKCIFCNNTEFTVLSSKVNKTGNMRIRVKTCSACERKYETVETIAYKMPRLYKIATGEQIYLTKDDLYVYILKIDKMYEGNLRKHTLDKIYTYIMTFFTRSGDMFVDDSALEDLITDIYHSMAKKESVIGNFEQKFRDRNIQYER